MAYDEKISRMRFRAAGALGLVGGLVLVWTISAGCSGPQDAPPRVPAPPDAGKPAPLGNQPSIPGCVRDVDCISGFCDRGHCGNVFGAGHYGIGCTQRSASGVYPPCGSYLCLEQRCRSCQSDSECDYWTGPPSACNVYEGKLGKSCGLDPHRPFSHDLPPPAAPDAGVFPAVSKGPPLPEEERRTFNSPCSRDSDCRSGFCDRGLCVDLYSKGNYGRECDPRLPPLVDEPDPSPRAARATPFVNRCMGYLCIDRRCRSCDSDTECQDRPKDSKCLAYQEWPGKRCGLVDDASFPLPGSPP